LKHNRVGRLPVLHVEGRDDFGHFPDSCVQRGGKNCHAPATVDGAEGLQTPIGACWNQAIGRIGKRESTSTQAIQKIGAQGTHVAGDDQVPFEGGIEECGFHSGEGPVAGPQIGDHTKPESRVFLRIADQSGITGGITNQTSSLLCESDAIDLQESFIRPHSRTVPARQDVTGYAHAEMIALKFVPNPRLNSLAFLTALPILLCAGLYGEEAGSNRTTLVVKTDNRTGRLVRSVVVTPKVINPEIPNQPEPVQAENNVASAGSSLDEMIDAIAAKHEVEGPLVHSVIKAESNYNPAAVSPKGAQGLMQLIPATARRFGVENTFNPQQNIEGGVKYLKFLMELYHNDYVKVIAAYNAGEAAVTKYGGIPPYAETRNYVYQVGKNLQTARKVAEAKNAAPKVEETKPAPADPNQPHSIQAVIGPDGKLYYKTQ